MIVNVHFHYDASFLKPRMRSADRVTLMATMPMRIREVASKDAVLAFLVADMSGDMPELSPLSGRARRIISLEGKFWREIGDVARLQDMANSLPRPDPAGGDDHAPGDEQGTVSWIALRPDNPFQHLVGGPGSRARTVAQIEAESHVRKWNDDGGASKAAAVVDAASRVVIVGQVAYHQCDEPCWIVTRRSEGPRGSEVVIRLAFPENDGPRYRPRRYYDPTDTLFHAANQDERVTHLFGGHDLAQSRFRLGRAGDAVAFATTHDIGGLLGGVDNAEIQVEAVARVVVAGMDCLPDDVLALEAAAGLFVDEHSGDLATASRAMVASWAALRDACEVNGVRFREGVRPMASPQLADALERALEGWGRNRGGNRLAYGNETRIGYGPARDVFRSHTWRTMTGRNQSVVPGRSEVVSRVALARWKSRPCDDGNEWTHMAIVSSVPDVLEVTTAHDARTLGAMLGVDMSGHATMAADGKVRILVHAPEGCTLPQAAVVDSMTGMPLRSFGPGGKDASRDAMEAFRLHGGRAGLPVPARP